MIHVLIERRIAEGLEAPYRHRVKAMINAVVNAHGFNDGASLWDANNPRHHVILSKWQHLEDWYQWLGSDERKQASEALRPLLDEPEKVTILTPEQAPSRIQTLASTT